MNASEINCIRTFYEAERNALFAWALVMSSHREVAEDIVHDVFAKLLRQERLPRELRPYVFQAIRNTAINERQRRKRVEANNHRAEITLTGNPIAADCIQTRISIEEFLGMVEPLERECLTLKECAGWTFKEIAAFQERSINTVISCHRRALEKLRNLLERTNE